MILPFDKISRNDADKAGGKGASLGEMTRSGIAIPPGFIVLAETFEEFIDNNNLRAEIQTILSQLDHNNVSSIEHASERIQELIHGGVISEKIQEDIQKYSKTIKTDFVAVRSSATAEDGADHAWAGQLDTYLNVSKTDIIAKIQSCWASLFTPRALFYRSEKGLRDLHISVAVVIQSMVDAESAGVAFSVHPVTENTDEIVIEGSWGLGEAVVSGEVTPDSFVISKSSGEIISEHIAEKKKGIFRNTNGENEWRNIEKHEQEISILSQNKLSELAKLIIKIENHYGFPCDIEWAFSGGKFYILQARPITTLSQNFGAQKKVSVFEGVNQFVWETWLERLWGAFMLSFSEQSFTPTNIQNAGFTSLSMDAMLFQGGMWYYSQEVFDHMDADLEKYFMSHSIFDLTRSLSHFMHQSEMRIKELIVSNASLRQKFEEVYNIMSTAMTFIWITHSIESYYNKKLQIEVPKYVTTDIDTFIGDASFPVKPNLHMILDGMIRDGKTSQEIVEKAGWVKVRDGFSAPYTVEEIDEMRRHTPPLQNHKKITIPDPLKALFEQIQELVFFRTERTDVFYYLFFLTRPIIEQMGFQYGISFQEMKYYKATGFLDGVPEKYSDKVSFGYYHGESIFQETPILVEPSSNTLDEDAPIRGVIAFRGKIQGKVKIVTHTSQLEKVDVGDILVTQMTFPSFISAMHRASAFITDEGGITCHAAIIARELKKPCIIGTKNATRILKDGDMVEVDADNGVVRILKKEESFLKNKDLEVWIERKQSIFSMTVFHELESKVMNEDLGGGFKTQICFMRNKVCSYIHEVGDLENVIKNISRKLQNTPKENIENYIKDMFLWEKKGLKILQEGQKKVMASDKTMEKYLEDYKEIAYWTTVVPYFLLEAIHTLEKTEKYKKLTEVCEKLRSNSLYPVLNEKITHSILEKICQKIGLEKEDSYYITWSEVMDGLRQNTPQEIQGVQLRKNKDNAFYREKNGKIVFLENEKDIQILADLACGKDSSEVIQGKKCYPGKVTGRVKILRTREDMKEFQEGDILVSPNSNPSLMPCIKKCSAIITDEGGVSCHAAIISRELKIPCIIGTKNATRILKDGDLVEVDANNGVVKNISPNNNISNTETNEWYHLGKWIEPALAAEVWLEYGKVAQKFFKNKLDGKILYINGDFFLSQHDVDIIKKESYDAAKSNNMKFFDNMSRIINEVINSIVKESREIKSVNTFLESYKKLTGVWMPLNIVAIGVEEYVNEVDPKLLLLTNGSTQTKPLTLKEVEEMRTLKKELKTVPSDISTLPKTLQKKILDHVNKYEWLGTHHFMIHKFTVEELLQKMREDKIEVKPKVQASKNKELIKLLDVMGYIRFRCAETSGYTTYYLSKELSKIADKFRLSYEEIVEHTVEEISGKNISKKIADDRKKNTGFLYDGEIRILSETQTLDYTNKLLSMETSEIDEFKGITACKGYSKGIIKIVTSKSDMKGFEQGMILVAYETTPDVIPAMKKAAGIITDFGGLTSHAAIVSREFNIPCIVGTKNATQILKDGDLVEVDAENGVVKILERNTK